MIEREFVREKIKYMKVKEYITKTASKAAGIALIDVNKTPLGERVTVYAVKPGLIIGRAGGTISDLTRALKNDFKLENPQIEVKEVQAASLSAHVIASRIVSDLEKFGVGRFKALGYRMLQDIMRAGALGAEIKISGKVPGARAKSWRFPAGYMKKCGKVAMEDVDTAVEVAVLKAGVVGIQVFIMPPNIKLPDRVNIIEPVVQQQTEIKETPAEAKDENKEANVKEKEMKKERSKTKKQEILAKKQSGEKQVETEVKEGVKEVGNIATEGNPAAQ